MNWIRRHYPFNAEQSVNILSEFGPLVTMFVVNAAAGIDAGTWSLIITTVLAMVVMKRVLGRLPIFPQIASTVTIVFGALTLITGDPMWVQIKVTIFNAMFAGFLFGGLAAAGNPLRRISLISMVVLAVLGVGWIAVHFLSLGPDGLGTAAGTVNGAGPTRAGTLFIDAMCVGSLIVGFVAASIVFRRNFFQYAFEKTFHYTRDGWDKFTFNFAWFFVFTAVANELVRQTFKDTQIYDLLGWQMNGVNVWILFKIALIMPLSGLFAWYLTQLLQKHRISDEQVAAAKAAGVAPEDYVAATAKSAAARRVEAASL